MKFLESFISPNQIDVVNSKVNSNLVYNVSWEPELNFLNLCRNEFKMANGQNLKKA